MGDSIYAGMIVAIMIVAGILGGFASYHLNDSDNKELKRSLTLGVAASIITPVFLNMISSNLLVEAQKQIDKIFIFAGFCVLASTFSRIFLENVSNRVLQQVGDLGKKVQDIEEASSELPLGEVPPEKLKGKEISQDEFKLLKVLSEGKFTYRSMRGLQKESEWERPQLDTVLNTLIAKEFVQTRINNKGQMRYFLSGKGRQLLGELSME